MKNRPRRSLIALAVLASLSALPTYALFEQGTTQPATQETKGALQVTVAEVKGNVQVRADDKAAWQAAKVGMVVDQGAEFRTGPRSSVRCTIPPDQSFTLDRLGTVKVLTALQNGNKVTTEMTMKYGRTKYSVEAAGIEHEGTISSPSGTLAVRGTVVSMYDQPPFVPEAVSYTGRAMFRDAHRKASVGSKGGKKQTLAANKSSVAQTALDNGVIDPKYGDARTTAEATYIASQVSPGGVVTFDQLRNIVVVTNSTPIANTQTLSTKLPGGFDIVARWFGNADVNLEVAADLRDPNVALNDPKGFHVDEFLYPGFGLNKSKSGGQIPFDNRGGPNGGTELAFWKTPPNGVFGIGALLISGVPQVELKVNAFLNGKLQDIFFIDAQGNFVKSTTLDVTLDKNSLIGGPIVFIPAVQLLEDSVPTEGEQPGVRHQISMRANARAAARSHHSPPAVTSPAAISTAGGRRK